MSSLPKENEVKQSTQDPCERLIGLICLPYRDAEPPGRLYYQLNSTGRLLSQPLRNSADAAIMQGRIRSQLSGLVFWVEIVVHQGEFRLEISGATSAIRDKFEETQTKVFAELFGQQLKAGTVNLAEVAESKKSFERQICQPIDGLFLSFKEQPLITDNAGGIVLRSQLLVLSEEQVAAIQLKLISNLHHLDIQVNLEDAGQGQFYVVLSGKGLTSARVEAVRRLVAEQAQIDSVKKRSASISSASQEELTDEEQAAVLKQHVALLQSITEPLLVVAGGSAQSFCCYVENPYAVEPTLLVNGLFTEEEAEKIAEELSTIQVVKDSDVVVRILRSCQEGAKDKFVIELSGVKITSEFCGYVGWLQSDEIDMRAVSAECEVIKGALQRITQEIVACVSKDEGKPISFFPDNKRHCFLKTAFSSYEAADQGQYDIIRIITANQKLAEIKIISHIEEGIESGEKRYFLILKIDYQGSVLVQGVPEVTYLPPLDVGNEGSASILGEECEELAGLLQNNPVWDAKKQYVVLKLRTSLDARKAQIVLNTIKNRARESEAMIVFGTSRLSSGCTLTVKNSAVMGQQFVEALIAYRTSPKTPKTPDNPQIVKVQDSKKSSRLSDLARRFSKGKKEAGSLPGVGPVSSSSPRNASLQHTSPGQQGQRQSSVVANVSGSPANKNTEAKGFFAEQRRSSDRTDVSNSSTPPAVGVKSSPKGVSVDRRRSSVVVGASGSPIHAAAEAKRVATDLSAKAARNFCDMIIDVCGDGSLEAPNLETDSTKQQIAVKLSLPQKEKIAARLGDFISAEEQSTVINSTELVSRPSAGDFALTLRIDSQHWDQFINAVKACRNENLRRISLSGVKEKATDNPSGAAPDPSALVMMG